MRLIDADALKEDLTKWFPQFTLEGIEPKTLFAQIMCDIDNAPTVEIPISRYDAYCEGQKVGYEKGITDRPQGEWIRLDLAKRVVAKFEDYLDDDMILRIQIALVKENEADMKGGEES